MNMCKYCKDYQTFKEHHTPKCKTVNEYMTELLKNESAEDFSNKTKLLPYMRNRLMNKCSVADPVAKSTLMSVAIGYGKGYECYKRWVCSNGTGINLLNERDMMYQYMMECCKPKNVEEANRCLKNLGCPDTYLLGSRHP